MSDWRTTGWSVSSIIKVALHKLIGRFKLLGKEGANHAHYTNKHELRKNYFVVFCGFVVPVFKS